MERLNELEKQLTETRQLLYQREKEIYELRQYLPSWQQPKLQNRLTTSEIQILNVTDDSKIQPLHKSNATVFTDQTGIKLESNSQCLTNGINSSPIQNPLIQSSIGQSEIYNSTIGSSLVQSSVVQSPIVQPSIGQSSMYQSSTSQPSIFQSSTSQSSTSQSSIFQSSICSCTTCTICTTSPLFQSTLTQTPVVQANEVLDKTIYYLDQTTLTGITPVSGQILVPLNQLTPLEVPNKKINVDRPILSKVPIKTESDLESSLSSDDSNDSNAANGDHHFNNDELTSVTEKLPNVQFLPDIPDTSVRTDNTNIEEDIVTIKTEDIDLGADDLLEQGGTVIAIQDGQVIDTLTEIIKQHSTILNAITDGDEDSGGDGDKDTDGDGDKDTDGDGDKDTGGDGDKDSGGDGEVDRVTVKTEVMDVDTEISTQEQQDTSKEPKDEKVDIEKLKEKEEEFDCVIDCIIENPMPKKERVKRKIEPTLDPSIKGVPGVWSCEIVCDEQMWEWRQEDSTNEDYKTAPFRCSSCILGFHSARDSRNHNLMTHSLRMGQYVCDVCQTRCAEEYILNEHRDIHKRVYKCLKCDFIDRDKEKLLEHCETFTHSNNTCEHSNDKSKCELCNPKKPPMRSFRTSVFTCDYCSQTYITRASLVNHIGMQHERRPTATEKASVKPKPVPPQSPQKLPFECYTCKKRFRFQGELFSHRKLFHPYRKRVYQQPTTTTTTPNVEI